METKLSQSQMLTLLNLALQIDLARPCELKAMHQYAKEHSTDFVKPASDRATWRRIAAMLKQEFNQS